MLEHHVAYVLLDIGRADAAKVRKQLEDIRGVKLAHTLMGPDDLICFIEAEGYSDYNDILNKQIRALKDVERTETIPVLSVGNYAGYGKVEPRREACWTLISCTKGPVSPVIDALIGIPNVKKGIPGVKNAHAVLGRYDVIAYVEADTWKELLETMNKHIRTIPQVSRTDSRIVLLSQESNE